MYTAFMVLGKEDMALVVIALGLRCALMVDSRVDIGDLESNCAERIACGANVMDRIGTD